MIRFRFGVRDAVPTTPAAAVAAASPVVVAAAVSVAVPPLESPWELPLHLRPLPIAEEEESAIRFGGASPYPPEKKKK